MASITLDELVVIINAQTKNFNKQIAEVNGQLEDIGKTGKKTDKSLSSSFSKIGKVAKTSLMVGVAGSIAAITASIPAAVRRVDTLNNSSRVFENMGFKTKDAEEAMEALNKSILGLPTPLDSAVRGMTALAATYGDVKLGQEVFSALNNAILGFGGSAAQVDNAIMQLSQLPMDGPLDAQTWNSLRNSGLTPVIVAMAEDMGMGVAEMKEAFGEGELKVQDFIDRLIKMDKEGGGSLKSLQQIAQDSTKGIGTSFANLRTAIARQVANVIKELGPENFSGAINGFAGLVDDIGKKLISEIPKIRQGVHDAMAKVLEFGDLIKGGNLQEAGKQLGTAIGNGIAEAIKLMRIGMDAIKGWFGSIDWGQVGTAVGMGALAFIAGFVMGVFSTESLMQFVGFIADNWVEILLLVASIAFAPARLLGPFGKLFSGVIGKIPFGQYFTAAFGKIVTAIRNFTEPIRAAAHSSFAAPVSGVVSGMVNSVRAILSSVKDIILQPFRLAVAYVADAIRMIPPVAGSVVNAIKAFFDPMFAWFRVLFTNILNVARAAFDMFTQPARSAWSGIQGVFGGVAGWFRGIFQNAWNQITSIFGRMADWFGNINLFGAGQKMIQSFINGIKNMVGSAKDAAASVVQSVRDYFPFSPAKEGPLSGKGYTSYSGQALMKDFAAGVEKGAKGIDGTISRAILPASEVLDGLSLNLPSGASLENTRSVSLPDIDRKQRPIILQLPDGSMLGSWLIDEINGRSFLANDSVIYS